MTDIPHQSWQLPHEPPLVTADLRPVGGHVGPELDDFQVEEIPAYLPSGAGDHRYVRLEKRGLSTPELVSIVARCADVAERDIGTAGLKDKHAITTQWLSLPKRSIAADAWQLPNTVRLIEESFHNNKLRTGHLHGNRFKIRLVEVSADAPSILPALVERTRQGVLNAFAEQRFGRDGRNIQAAFEWLKDPRQLRGPKARFLGKLYPSVIQSELFNRYLTLRLTRGLSRLMAGELVRLDGSGSSFVVEDLAVEQMRYERGELHLLGPMFGPKMRPAKHDALDLEQAVLTDAKVDPATLEQLSDHAPGTRRDVWLKPAEFEVRLESQSQFDATARASADASPGLDTSAGFDGSAGTRFSARMVFSLPSGSYATHLVREFTHSPWFGSKNSSASATD